MKVFLTASILIIILGFRFFFFFESRPVYQNGQSLNIETDLLSEPRISGRFQKFNVVLEGGQKLFVTAARFPEFNYGDHLSISGKLLISRKFNLLTMNHPKIEEKQLQKNKILAVTSFIRQRIISVFEANLPPNLAGLLLGIVFGIKEEIPKNFYETLRISGTLHVIAASGMNVTMTGGFLASMFAIFLRRQIAVFLAIFGILFYAVLSGLEASIVRASIMGILVFSSQILGRQNFAFYSLLLTGFIMLFFDPNLLFDVGFQLSFLATAGLLFLLPLFPFRNFFLGNDFATTLSAQMAVLPIIISNFGAYSLFSILTNTLVLWTIPFVMVIGGLSAFLSLVIEPLARISLYFSIPLLLYFEKVVSFFASFGQTSLNLSSPFFILGYYLILIAVILFIRKN